jgi:hypothetical protein
MDLGVERMDRFLRGYKTAAIHFLNSVILLVLATILAHLILPKRGYQKPVYSQDFIREAYQRTDPQVVQAVWKEYDDMGERSSYMFYPWTVFIERPYAGQFLGVTEQSIRRTAPPAPPDQGKPELLVWMFGGSTMFGWGLTDEQSIPSHVQAILQQRLPGYRVVVVNHGHAYWFSSMEISHFIALARKHSPPHAAVFLDGLNDSIRLPAGQDVPYFSDQAYDAWEKERLRRYGTTQDEPWIKMNDSFPLLRVARSLSRRMGLEKPPEPPRSRYFQKPADPIATALRQFRFNRDLLQAIGKQAGIKTVQVLQPLPTYGQYTQFKTKLQPSEQTVRFYDVFSRESAPGFYPLQDALLDMAHPFVDASHYGDEASFRIAERIVGILLQERSWIPGQPKLR